MSHAAPRIAWVGPVAALCVIGLAAAAVARSRTDVPLTVVPSRPSIQRADHGADRDPSRPAGPTGTVTLAFAGDIHFQIQLAALLDHPKGALGPITASLRAADLTMVNLESSIAARGTPDPKELEVSSDRYWFRTSPRALAVLDAAGVDVVTMANNHGADYGSAGFAETLRARRAAHIAIVGIGRNRQDAFTPYRVSVRGTDFAFLAADASMREGSSSVWAAGPTTPGIAAAHADRPRDLIAAVRDASTHADVVVVYMHWGEQLRGCPTHQQTATASALADAGADVILGSHAHVLLGSGWLGDTYVDYGLGNFLWYHNHQPETGVLRVRISDGQVVGDSLVPARIQSHGRPIPLVGPARAVAVAEWRGLRTCTGLASRPETSRGLSAPTGHQAPPTAYTATVRPIGPRLRDRMQYSHHPGCPVALADLRYLEMTYLGFDGTVHTGEMVVHKKYAAAVVGVFHRLYNARWPIRRMRLIDDYRGDDDGSMAANNTSGYNCRRVAGSRAWSTHAHGAGIDINPVQNPDLIGPTVGPPAGRRFAATGRSAGARPPQGVITANGPVVRAFTRIGWEWGGTWSSGRDYQHFSAVE